MDILDCIREPFGLSPDAVLFPLGNGHINETRLVRDGDRRLVAQRINTAVFPEPDRLVENACRIESHLAETPGAPRVVKHLAGANGRLLQGPHRDVRVLEYISGSRCIEVLENPVQAQRAAASFGRFSRHMGRFDPAELHVVIPDFHSPRNRWDQFQAALGRDRVGRVADCAGEIEFALEHEQHVAQWHGMLMELPPRICHNDCKINNLLVDQHDGEPLAIIDLDTCMPGSIVTDFGDLVRSCCSPEPEDSTRLDSVFARPEVYRALAEGYLAGWKGELTQAERDSLLPGGMMMCFVLGLRFLADFIDGDRYFSVDHPLHNLERSRNQFRLFQSLLDQKDMFARLA